jgi:hypothetical protein
MASSSPAIDFSFERSNATAASRWKWAQSGFPRSNSGPELFRKTRLDLVMNLSTRFQARPPRFVEGRL